MKLKNAPIRSVIKCVGCKAVVLHHGAMGTRVDITSVKDPQAATLGKTVWSNETDVILTDEIAPANNKQINLGD